MLAQERELAHFPEWTPATILERREKLVRWALERWAVPGLPEELAEELMEDTEE